MNESFNTSNYSRITLTPDSSNVEWVGYDMSNQKMTIKFRSGRVYVIAGTLADYISVVAADSVGTAVREMLDLRFLN